MSDWRLQLIGSLAIVMVFNGCTREPRSPVGPNPVAVTQQPALDENAAVQPERRTAGPDSIAQIHGTSVWENPEGVHHFCTLVLKPINGPYPSIRVECSSHTRWGPDLYNDPVYICEVMAAKYIADWRPASGGTWQFLDEKEEWGFDTPDVWIPAATYKKSFAWTIRAHSFHYFKHYGEEGFWLDYPDPERDGYFWLFATAYASEPELVIGEP